MHTLGEQISGSASHLGCVTCSLNGIGSIKALILEGHMEEVALGWPAEVLEPQLHIQNQASADSNFW